MRRPKFPNDLLFLFFFQVFSPEEEAQGATYSSFELKEDLDEFKSFLILFFPNDFLSWFKVAIAGFDVAVTRQIR
jgi:hypothetical protein